VYARTTTLLLKILLTKFCLQLNNYNVALRQNSEDTSDKFNSHRMRIHAYVLHGLKFKQQP